MPLAPKRIGRLRLHNRRDAIKAPTSLICEKARAPLQALAERNDSIFACLRNESKSVSWMRLPQQLIPNVPARTQAKCSRHAIYLTIYNNYGQNAQIKLPAES